MKQKKTEFKLPNITTLSSRKSSIAKSFSDGIAPRIQPTDEEYEKFLEFFPKVDNSHKCAYCGEQFDYYEHFRPLVVETKPTGYGSDIYNLVPSCSNCNQRKGNSSWKDWMKNSRNKSILDGPTHMARINKLEEFEKWSDTKVIFIDYEKIVGSEKWQQYMSNYQSLRRILNEMNELQKGIKRIVDEEVKTIQEKIAKC
jgi:hypothetical protein